MMTEENKVTTEMPEEPELYEEPARMSVKDGAGVVIALVLLAAIAVAGYVWLTPGMSFSNLRPGGGKADSGRTTDAQQLLEYAGADIEAAADEHVRCAQCGMFADMSASHVIAQWSDGNSTDHDSWGCVFGYGADNGLTLTSAQVVEYNSALAGPANREWLDAQSAMYLVKIESLPGSMPPFVAAFENHEAALAAQGELRGEMRDFSALAAEWKFSAYDFAAKMGQAEPMSEMTEPMPAEHDMEQLPPVEAVDQSASRIDPLAAPHTHDHDMSCPYCGMPADASGSQVVVIWSNGNHEHYDSWDCLFSDGKEQGLEIVRAVARHYDAADAEPRWLKVQQAWYLYDTNKIPMSMPPYVAAFESSTAAKAAQAELGGELVSFAGLSAYWE